ncbi:HNH endonuclease [Hymenobacter jejuensis]|uniref:HNH endonuclease n=1 Tax=Hymenobacter jejuensis TaxID=2502781 RepID=UPI00157FFB8F|nr:HNH endonuclease [Hymenobacter jejuensis]
MEHRSTDLAAAGDIFTYAEMCWLEKTNLRRGMNFRLHGRQTIILMSRRPDAPYADRFEEHGRILIYEGHDIPRNELSASKLADQQLATPRGTLTQNGRFFEAARRAKLGEIEPEPVRVYEKIDAGVWVFNGVFALIDAWREADLARQVFKFKLRLIETDPANPVENQAIGNELIINSLLSASVKQEVWKREKGRCQVCGSTSNLHFALRSGVSSSTLPITAANVQLLCAFHYPLEGEGLP